MWRSMFKVATATAVFGLVHSALASRTAKRAAARTFGERNRNGLYRVVYIEQSLVTFGLLAAYIRRQPSRELYRIGGSLALLMHAIQAGAVVYATAAAGQVGLRRITGLESFSAWLGDGPVPPEPSPAQLRPAADLLALAADDNEPARLQYCGNHLSRRRLATRRGPPERSVRCRLRRLPEQRRPLLPPGPRAEWRHTH